MQTEHSETYSRLRGILYSLMNVKYMLLFLNVKNPSDSEEIKTSLRKIKNHTRSDKLWGENT